MVSTGVLIPMCDFHASPAQLSAWYISVWREGSMARLKISDPDGIFTDLALLAKLTSGGKGSMVSANVSF